MTPELPRVDYGAHPAYGGMFEPDPALGRQALDILEPIIEEVAKGEEERARQFGYRYGGAGSHGKALTERGITRMQLTEPTVDRLHRIARPILDMIAERSAAARSAGQALRFKTVQHNLDKDADGELWSTVDDVLRDSEVYDLTASFFGARGAKLKSSAVLVNPPNQEWANVIFRDVEVQTPPTAGFHIDSNGKCFVRGLLYLDDVGPEQGPFSMIPGSHRWSEGSQDRIYRRAFDKSPMVSRGASDRRMFISLPPHMQVKAEFGGDILPGAPEGQALLDQELVCTGPRGTLSLFTPEAVHRGGNVRSGRRLVLMMTMAAQW